MEELNFEQTKKKAEAGDVRAQFSLGKMYYYGNQVIKDYTLAKMWIDKSIAKGNGAAEQFWEYEER